VDFHHRRWNLPLSGKIHQAGAPSAGEKELMIEHQAPPFSCPMTVILAKTTKVPM
jgi:hypothetical protein